MKKLLAIIKDYWVKAIITCFIGTSVLFGNEVIKSLKSIVVNDNSKKIEQVLNQNKTILIRQDSIFTLLRLNTLELKKNNQQINVLRQSVSKNDKNLNTRFDDIQSTYEILSTSNKERNYSIAVKKKINNSND